MSDSTYQIPQAPAATIAGQPASLSATALARKPRKNAKIKTVSDGISPRTGEPIQHKTDSGDVKEACNQLSMKLGAERGSYGAFQGQPGSVTERKFLPLQVRFVHPSDADGEQDQASYRLVWALTGEALPDVFGEPVKGAGHAVTLCKTVAAAASLGEILAAMKANA